MLALPMLRRNLVGAMCAALGLLLPTASHGNGAFPDTAGLLLPREQPNTIILGTNFGLVTTTDGGGTWRWACEHDDSVQGAIYQLAAPPGARLFTISTVGLAYTDDLGCHWFSAPGQESTLPIDYFPDPTDGRHVLIIAAQVGASGIFTIVLESRDGGASFGPPLYQAPAGESVQTIESFRGDPRILYITTYKSDGTDHGRVLRSADGGKTWDMRDPGELKPHNNLGIAAVDPQDAQHLVFRVTGLSNDALAYSDDGGKTLKLSLDAVGTLKAFIRLHDGTILTSGLADTEKHMYRSRDGGRTFQEIPTTVHARGFGERDGRLYAATDDQRDGAALSLSMDGGDTWKPVMRLADVSDVIACPGLRAVCRPSCVSIAQTTTFRDSFCAKLAEPETAADAGAPPDAAAGTDAAEERDAPAADAHAKLDGPAKPDAGAANPPPSEGGGGGGGGCRYGGAGAGAGGAALALAALALALRVRRRPGPPGDRADRRRR